MTQDFKPRYSMFYPSRSLGLLQIVLVLAMILTALPLVGSAVLALLGKPYHLKVFDLTSSVQIWLLAFGFTALMEWLLWLLLRVIRNAAQGRVFEWQNVKDLRVLGWCFVAYWLAPIWLYPWLTSRFYLRATFDPVSLLKSPLTIALLFFAFSEVLRQGVRLQAEQELTI